MSWLSQAFSGKNKNPADVANSYLGQIPGKTQPYYQPFMDSGKNQLANLTGQYGQQTSDPASVYNKFAAGYQESPGYQFKLQQALNAEGNAQARGGMLGTLQDQQYAGQIGHDYANQDFEDYMNRITGIYGQGQAGQQTLESQGYGANTDYAQMLAQLLGTQGQYAYAGQAGENANRSQNRSSLLKLLGSLIPGLKMPGEINYGGG